MLTHIDIRDFALIEHISLELQQGFTVITGETGAGKSILLDALYLGLGERADSQVVRPGKELCHISLTFTVDELPDAQQWLHDHDFPTTMLCIIRRVIPTQGSSRCYLNDIPCSLQSLREFTRLLVTGHSQHQQQLLLKTAQQRQLLDNFAGHKNLVQTVQQHYQALTKIQQATEELTAQLNARDNQRDFLQFQVAELNDLALNDQEWEQLDQEHKTLSSVEYQQQQLAVAHQLLNGESGTTLLGLLAQLQQQLKPLAQAIPAVRDLIQQADINLQEANTELRQYQDSVQANPERLTTLEQRLSTIHTLARKYRCEPQQLLQLQQQLTDQLTQLEQLEIQLTKRQEESALMQSNYQAAAKQLSHSRQQAAKLLSARVTQLLQQLNMPHAQFTLNCQTNNDNKPTRHGNEQIDYYFTANLGQPATLLHKIASGGELSRIILAIYVSTCQKDCLSTLIFDEVDVGISGVTAEYVGELLAQLGERNQLLCITHLPQIAARGQQHLYVQKTIAKEQTMTQVTVLNYQERIETLAHLLGGKKATEHTRAHAAQLLGISTN